MITNTEIEKKGNLYPNHIIDFRQDNERFTFTTKNGVILQITILRDSALRFRYATDFAFEDDFSYAISEDASTGYNELSFENKVAAFEITTSKIKIFVTKENLKVHIEDLEGQPICEEDTGFHWEENFDYGGNVVKMSKVAQSGESFYGMGDQSSHTNLKGKRVSNWVTDSYAYGKDQSPLYKAIPFLCRIT